MDVRLSMQLANMILVALNPVQHTQMQLWMAVENNLFNQFSRGLPLVERLHELTLIIIHHLKTNKSNVSKPSKFNSGLSEPEDM